MKRKTTRQLSAILLVAMSFALFNFSIYHIFTKRCLNSYGADMQAKSVELDEYLPFEKDSKVVKVNALLALCRQHILPQAFPLTVQTVQKQAVCK